MGFGEICENNWQECNDHVKFTDIIKPDPPKVEEPKEPKVKKEKKEKVK
jgi:hypothetical protein